MKKIIIAFGVCLFILGALIWVAGSYLSKPANRAVVMPKSGFESFEFEGTHGSVLLASESRKCALLLHGVRSDRSSMVERANFLKKLGFTSALVDLQAHGETKGEVISFGHFESRDASNGMHYLRIKRGCEKVLVIGQSLGGASALLGSAAGEADALILESVFPTIEEAVRDRLESKIGAFAGIAAPLLYLQIPIRIGVPIEKLRPIEAIKSVKAPVFVIGGTLDQSTTPSETKRMFEAVHSSKKLWLVEGAAHQDIYTYNRSLYEQNISLFIEKSI